VLPVAFPGDGARAFAKPVTGRASHQVRRSQRRSVGAVDRNGSRPVGSGGRRVSPSNRPVSERAERHHGPGSGDSVVIASARPSWNGVLGAPGRPRPGGQLEDAAALQRCRGKPVMRLSTLRRPSAHRGRDTGREKPLAEGHRGMCVRTFFQRAAGTGAGGPKLREQSVGLAARRASLAAWRSGARTAMPVVGGSSRVRRAPQPTRRGTRGRDGGRVSRGHQVRGSFASGCRLACRRLAPCRPSDGVA
jgi:hypothetical protein